MVRYSNIMKLSHLLSLFIIHLPFVDSSRNLSSLQVSKHCGP